MESAGRNRDKILLSAGAVTAVLTLAACGSGGDSELDPGAAADAPDYSRAIEAAPPRLASLYSDGNELLEGGLDAFEVELARLEGFPVVVNKWASWCGPCRQEFPHLQNQAAEHADVVAFLGINSDDSVDGAETFLSGHPVPYPSFLDPDLELAGSLDVRLEFPATVFLDREGEIVHVRRGVYASEEDLAADVERYALNN
jgi:thiol-disulfide isomerase/thioredoxin